MEKISFANLYNRRPSSDFFSKKGTKTENKYGLVVNTKTGKSEVTVVGETNLDAIIQSNRDSGNIQLLIARLKSGDNEALNQVKGFYGDFRNMPTNYADMVSRINDCHNLFNALPAAIKEQFNNSPDEFWTSFGSSEFEYKMGFSPESEVKQLEVVDEKKGEKVDEKKGEKVDE